MGLEDTGTASACQEVFDLASEKFGSVQDKFDALARRLLEKKEPACWLLTDLKRRRLAAKPHRRVAARRQLDTQIRGSTPGSSPNSAPTTSVAANLGMARGCCVGGPTSRRKIAGWVRFAART